MGKYAYYDQKERVIFCDFSGLGLTLPILRETTDELISLSKQVPGKVFVVTCWKDTKLTTEVMSQFGEEVDRLLQHVAGVLRYEVNDAYANIVIRSETVLHRAQKMRANIYASREEALAAVRRLEQERP